MRLWKRKHHGLGNGARWIGVATAVIAGAVVVKFFPELRRYLRMRRM